MSFPFHIHSFVYISFPFPLMSISVDFPSLSCPFLSILFYPKRPLEKVQPRTHSVSAGSLRCALPSSSARLVKQAIAGIAKIDCRSLADRSLNRSTPKPKARGLRLKADLLQNATFRKDQPRPLQAEQPLKKTRPLNLRNLNRSQKCQPPFRLSELYLHALSAPYMSFSLLSMFTPFFFTSFPFSPIPFHAWFPLLFLVVTFAIVLPLSFMCSKYFMFHDFAISWLFPFYFVLCTFS